MAKSNKLAASNVITGVPTEAKKAAVRALGAAKPRGGKPGSAMGNQSAQYAEGELTNTGESVVAKAIAAQKDSGGMAGKSAAKITRTKAREVQAAAAPAKPGKDVITECKDATGGEYVVVTAGGKSLPIKRSAYIGQLTKIAVVGGSMKAVEEYIKQHKPEAKLANGLSGKDAPQSAMAAAASRKAAAEPAAPVKTGKTAKVKAQKEAKAASKGDFAYSIGKPADRAEGSWTQHMLTMIQKAQDTAAAKALHAKSGKFTDKKLHFSWARDKGYIKY